MINKGVDNIGHIKQGVVQTSSLFIINKLRPGDLKVIFNHLDRIEQSIICSSATNVYFTGTQSGTIRLSKSIGTSKVKSASYSVENQNGTQIFKGNVAFYAPKSSTTIQLIKCSLKD